LDIRQFFFKYRGFTPIPIILVVLIFARPTPTSFVVGILTMAVGEIIRLWGVAYAGGATRTRHVGAPFLVTSGPFSRMRNPLYVGNMFMYCGAAVIANVWMPWLVLAVLLFFSGQYYFIIKLEEEKLEELYGQEYRDYMQKVRRFLPLLKPIRSDHPVKPDYMAALKSEKSTFMSFAAILALLFVRMTLL
jgi:protein-S-isoprenylcysteine O-methyltransferase Ste14